MAERRSSGRAALALLGVYAVALALILFWPEHIDRGAAGLLRRIAAVIPWATAARIEFAANIALFVPLGFLLAVLLARRRYLVVPIALVVTVAAESLQALLPDRTTSIRDIIANATGACVGLIIAEVTSRRRATPEDVLLANRRR